MFPRSYRSGEDCAHYCKHSGCGYCDLLCDTPAPLAPLFYCIYIITQPKVFHEVMSPHLIINWKKFQSK